MSWDAKLFQRHLATRRFGREFVWFDEIDSTNRWLIENAGRFTMSGAVVAADHQTAGRGRFQRTWDDVPGTALLFSVMLRLQNQSNAAGFASMLPAIAIAEVLRGSLGLGKNVRLKWPNDVLVNGKKVAGILGQCTIVNGLSAAIVGAGINVSTSALDFPADIRERATSIADEISAIPRREALLAAILGRWEDLFDAFLGDQIEIIRTTWEQFGPERGTWLTLREGDTVLAGHFAGLGNDGQLQLADDAGVIHEFHSGDMDA